MSRRLPAPSVAQPIPVPASTVPGAAAAERRQAAQSAALAREERRDGPDLQPQGTLDRDLQPLADPTAPRPPVRSVSRRLPHQVPLLYHGRRKGALHDQKIDLVVPDEENAAYVAQFADVLHPREGEELPTGATLHAHGPDYHFTLGEVTLVDKEDVPFFLTHAAYRFEQVAPTPAPSPTRAARR